MQKLLQEERHKGSSRKDTAADVYYIHSYISFTDCSNIYSVIKDLELPEEIESLHYQKTHKTHIKQHLCIDI